MKTNKSANGLENNDFPIVGIGASAGGLETLEQFFAKMPQNTGMAFVIIQHLDPNHIGMMPELLQRMTTMKVIQVTDSLKVKPNCVYIIPPNKSMSILNGSLHLFAPIETHGIRLPIDIFFRSLADDRQEKSIGIILSGMGSDGSLGLKAIKEKNGIVIVQEPSTAKFDGMPRSAVETVIADIIAPVEELPAKLINIVKFIPLKKNDPEIDSKNKSNLDKIIILLREQTGHDFSLYKKSTLFRRIERRKGIHQIDKIQNYVRFMQENPKETEILFKELLIGVTSFFRDTAVWEKLKEQVLPEMLEKLPNGYVMRAWVTGCSTGEEAYSLAITFKEVMEKIKKHRNISLQIFATDLDIDAIEKARKGIFPPNIITDVSPERLSRFFIVENDGFRINAGIREMVVFAPQNVIKDPPFTKLDILTCRNMLIYMEAELQKKIIRLFNYSLNPGGIMVLGSAETLGTDNEGFEILDAKLKIFKRSQKPTSPGLLDFPSSFSIPNKTNIKALTTPVIEENIQTLANQILLQRFAPASVLVSEKGDIIYITGRTGKYLEPVAGKANWNIFAMLRDDLKLELPIAFQKALKNYDPIQLRKIKIENYGNDQYVDVTLQQIEKPEGIKGKVMIVFKDLPEMSEPKVDAKKGKETSSARQKELEIELQQSLEDLQTIREEMQTSQEELKSTNEELQSTNEELQSTNEELTTSKEEMQSLNEELQTVNIELQSKVIDYVQANNDMKNLLNSTDIATLFLDKELNIRRFTDPITNIFKVRNTDIGRPFTDLVTDLQYPEIGIHAKQVIKTLNFIEKSVVTLDGRWFDIKIMPYRTLDDHIDGLVLTFNDVTKFKKLELELKEANEKLKISKETRYRRLFETAKDGILILDAETGKITDVNPFLIELLGYSKEQFVEKAIWEIGTFKDIIANMEKFKQLQQKEFIRYDNLPLETIDRKKINVEFISNIYQVENQKVVQCLIRDITQQKLAEEKLKISESRYRSLFESAKDGILVLDSENGTIVEINPYLIDMLGYTKNELLKKAIWEVGFFKKIIDNKDKFLKLQQKNFLQYEDLPLVTADGRKINVEFISKVFSIENHKVIQCFIRNIAK
ncbi:chemotaxis protein CheB [Flavobacterium limnophilum]|uniref:chemotaxis protein CheB n=1 Tax=Flavobacterium limnophilum TaxID=3003262 RepID=UPI002483234F|nr:chemotaxis protein CheB [Flavobacterium limnophilum]